MRVTCAQKSAGSGTTRTGHYEITLENRGPDPLSGLTCAYRLIIKRNDRYADERIQHFTEDGEITVPEIPARGKVTIKTAPVRMTRGNEADVEGDFLVLSKWTDSLAGINLSVRQDKSEVYAHSTGAFKDRGTPPPKPEPAPDDSDPQNPKP